MGDQPIDSGSSRSRSPAAAAASGYRMLIAGMHGFIGSHVAQAAQWAGIDVVGMSLQGDIDRARRFHESIGLDPVTSVAGDATDAKVLQSVIEQYAPDILVNAVGVIRTGQTGNWLGGYAVNYATAAATIDALAMTDDAKKPFTIWIGSQAEYGTATPPWTEATCEQPSSAYGASKQVASALILSGQRSGILDACVIRLPIVFGPGQAPTLIVASAICSALTGQRLPMTAGQQRRRFAFAPDIAESTVALGLKGLSGAVPPLVNSPASEPIEVRQVIHILETLLPAMQVNLGALEYRAGEILEAWPDSGLAQSIGLTAATPLEQALADTVAWYQTNAWFAESLTQ